MTAAAGRTGALPVVLLPGMLCDGALWDGVRGALTYAGAGPLVDVVPDVPAGSTPGIAAMARQVLDAVDGPFVLVGLSLGAIVGFEVCRRAPERVAGFAAMSTNAHAPRPEQYAGWRAAGAAAAAGEFERPVREDVLPLMFRAPDPGPGLAAAFLGMARRTGPTRYRTQLAAQATRTDALPALAAYGGPVLVVGGGRDALCPPAFHRAIAAAAPRSRLHELPGAGHLLPLEEPDATGELLADWLPRALGAAATGPATEPAAGPATGPATTAHRPS